MYMYPGTEAVPDDARVFGTSECTGVPAHPDVAKTHKETTEATSSRVMPACVAAPVPSRVVRATLEHPESAYAFARHTLSIEARHHAGVLCNATVRRWRPARLFRSKRNGAGP